MTKLERELLKECETIASHDNLRLADVIRDCHRFWCGAGRSIKPRGWAARAAAAARLVARLAVIDGHREIGSDASLEIENFDRLSTAELNDQLAYLADHQG
jgi:hypothetical protein